MQEPQELTCWSCKHVRAVLDDVPYLWCEPFKTLALEVCPRFVYEPGADERELLDD